MKENNNEQNNNIQEDDILKSESNNSNSQDSFNKDLQKKLEEYKKSEPRIPHRPISSYTSKRNFNQVNKEIDTIKKIPNKPQSAQTKSNNNSKNSNKKEQQSKSNTVNANENNKNSNNASNEVDLTVEQILQDLNNFLITHKIKKSDFLDNCGVFLNFEDFVDVFKQIHYTVNKKYLKMLFTYKNPDGAKDDYIHMKNFVNHLTFYKIDGIVSDSEFSKADSNTASNQSNSKFSQQNILSKTLSEAPDMRSNRSIYEIKYINEQYNQFNKEIIEILRNSKKKTYENKYSAALSSKRSNQKKGLGNSRISIESRTKKIDEEKTIKEKVPIEMLQKNKNIYNLNLDDNNEDNIYNDMYIVDEEKTTEQPRKKFDYSQILKNKEKEEEKDVMNMRLQFEKRDKNFLKDCVYKCEECNRICNLMGLNRTYSVAFDEEMKCRIQEEGKEDDFITLKELIIEWRRLYKQYHQKENLERYKEIEDINKNKNVELILNERKKEKEEKHRQIKEVLIEAVRLKTKLKSQLDDLKSNIKIDEKVVLEHLMRAGMEIPNINKENEMRRKKNSVKKKK